MSQIKNVQIGEIWLVKFDPSIGHEIQGIRPALVIQSNAQIEKSNLVTVLPLTSNLNNKLVDDIIIKKTSQNRLLHESVIKVYDIISFDYSRLINKIGSVDIEISNKIKEYLRKHFDLLK
ncbi:MAG: type II toxin-antitoxin system PemK/MazF family toxin [Parcubacteria group bacterium CG_4_9_14_0_2_um_filter_41_8]|nr:MAG: MazF family transcriptional regulator [Parcubacteria group bacterium CG11_big_fil_rev_8_21_14_0_20_41_14]PIR57251.1 MAG: type II toxin-antitoxin system PemK/MazF family toxin [Parcubacteria group bacterium CG10_big_fil_rev_8_21_14_0_10_41_35]PIZ81275.1 MAG: type II toxin-antitoxin system PemK/MazF family toxin [Parcubacteria group bacterium CG_4_10_14_0_2_um_filter_41_6]PJC40357.1 MAG: type II toxin-antitoxin system PemK/MazF family toxin [Parcubacteria group bacterium CG_4_9_14_0_2_um_f